jgi:hypothetical protein
VAEPHLNAVSSGSSGQGLIEVATRYLKCLGALTGKDFAKAEALPFRTLEKKRRILYLVPPSDYSRQKTCLIENVVAARQQRLADLKSREGARFKSNNAVPASSEQRAGYAPCGPSTNDQDVSVHQVVIRRAQVICRFRFSAFCTIGQNMP